MQTIATFGNTIAANLAKAELADAGIDVYLANEQTVSVAPHLTNAIGGIKLQVADEQAEEARAVLSYNETIPATRLHSVDEDDFSEEELATDESENAFTARERTADRAFRGAVISILIWPLSLYVLWLLIEILSSDQRLAPRHRRNAILAAVIGMPCAFITLFWFSHIFP